MNSLLGKFKISGVSDAGTLQGAKSFSSAMFDVNITRIDVFGPKACPYFYNQQTGVFCGFIGYVSNILELKKTFSLGDCSDAEAMGLIYAQKGCAELYKLLDGLFTVVISDELNKKGYVFQDENGSNLPLYYVPRSNELLFSTTLKGLLRISNCVRELDVQGAYDFLFYRFLFNGNMIPNELTLIKGVRKLVPKAFLFFDYQDQTIDVKHFPCQGGRLEDDGKGLMGSLSASVEILFQSLKERGTYGALSSGFDTNYLIWRLQGLSQGQVKAFTIGGRNKNEIPAARAMAMSYGNVVHYTRTLGEDTLDSFPDLVWRLEGYMFDPSCFLQIELSRQLQMEKASAVFLGDGADQVLDYSFYMFQPKINKQLWFNLFAKMYYQHIHKEPVFDLKVANVFLYLRQKASGRVSYYIMLDYILKNSGLILNSRNIQGLYPFLDRRVKLSSRQLGFLNWQKRYYKREVKRVVPLQVARRLSKIGGDTDIEYIFDKKKECLLKKIKDSETMRRLFEPLVLGQITENPQAHRYFILLMAYLCIFEELFISGRYDAFYNMQDLGVPLEQALSGG